MLDVKKQCCGCHACYNICPKQSIEMIYDEEGFLYPYINEEKCVSCGKCETVCPILNEYKGNEIGQAYACINKNEEVRIKSSSGGVFSLIAEYVLNNGGVVFGPEFDDNLDLKHIYIDKKEELYRLRGSKYLQSEIGDSYSEVKQFLKKGQLVLFSGTPCQISGLKNYLGMSYDNLIMQDIICHGVPSKMVWEKYLEYQEMIFNRTLDKKNAPSFRNKETGWKNYSVKLMFTDKSYYKQIFGRDLFMRAFLSDLCLRPSCYNCHSKSLERESDITIADFWGIETLVPEMNDNKGTSLVFVNSEKGAMLFEQIKNDMKFCQVSIKEAVKYNKSAYKSVKCPPARRRFMKNLHEKNFVKILNRCLKNKLSNRIKMKIKSMINY